MAKKPHVKRMYNQKIFDEDIEQLAVEFDAWMELPDSLWFKSFWLSKNLDYDYAVELSERNESLAFVFKKARAWQTARLLERGLQKELSEGLVKLVLYNTAGWSDKKQISGDAQNPLAMIINEIDGESKNLVGE